MIKYKADDRTSQLNEIILNKYNKLDTMGNTSRNNVDERDVSQIKKLIESLIEVDLNNFDLSIIKSISDMIYKFSNFKDFENIFTADIIRILHNLLRKDSSSDVLAVVDSLLLKYVNILKNIKRLDVNDIYTITFLEFHLNLLNTQNTTIKSAVIDYLCEVLCIDVSTLYSCESLFNIICKNLEYINNDITRSKFLELFYSLLIKLGHLFNFDDSFVIDCICKFISWDVNNKRILQIIYILINTIQDFSNLVLSNETIFNFIIDSLENGIDNVVILNSIQIIYVLLNNGEVISDETTQKIVYLLEKNLKSRNLTLFKLSWDLLATLFIQGYIIRTNTFHIVRDIFIDVIDKENGFTGDSLMIAINFFLKVFSHISDDDFNRFPHHTLKEIIDDISFVSDDEDLYNLYHQRIAKVSGIQI